MAALRICTPAGPPEPRRGNLAAGNPAQLGLDLAGFSSWVLPIGVGYAVDRRHPGGAVVTCHGFFVDSGGRRRSYPRASFKNGVICTLEDGGGGESTLCVSNPSETVSFSGGAPSDLGRSMVDGITGNPRSFAGRKKGGKLWRRLQGGNKLAWLSAPRRAPGKDREGRKFAVNDADADAILSGISHESSIDECNSVLIRLEKHSDEKALNFFECMKANGKLERNADAYHLAPGRRTGTQLNCCFMKWLPFRVAHWMLIYVCAKRKLID